MEFRSAPLTFSIETRLAADAQAVWQHASSMDGINRELAPLARMTAPAGMTRLDDVEIVLGQRLIRSWIYALGIVPIDYDDVTLVELEPGRRFLERSPMLSQRLWQHERTIDPIEGGCIVRDTIHYEPRLRLLGRLQLPIFRMVFANRHRQLARLFGRA